MNTRRSILSLFAVVATALPAGCRTWLINGTDDGVYNVIAQRQMDALGETHNAKIGEEDGLFRPRSDMYSFVPGRIDAQLPESFRTSRPREGGAEPGEGTEAVDSQDVPSDADAVSEGEAESDSTPFEDGADTEPNQAKPVVMGLSDVLGYAMRHSRELQDAKEDLYLAALDLTLERHLWTPQFVASVSAEFADYGQIRDFDRAMSTVSQVAVSQRLPFGGDVTARVINTLMRDLGVHTTSGETGRFIVEADIPLFRGAGRVAYESRYRAERQLIYAVRTYERFRRRFLVDIASDYFSLQQSKARIGNAEKNLESATWSAKRAEFYLETGRGDIFEKARAQSTFRQAESDVQNERESYQSALDQIKIRIGMSVEEPLDVVSQEDDEESRLLELLLPDVDKEAAIQVALKYRLDLRTVFDQIDDRKRGVVIAKNAILPDLDLSGSVTMNTDPNELKSLSYNTERATWRGMVELRMDDRKQERNAYRESLVNLRRAERGYDEAADRVRSDVRRALRRIVQSESTREIQRLNVKENEEREKAARELVNAGRRTNQDLVDAQNDLQRARNSLAAAEAGVRRAILEFRRDTGTLRVGDDGTFMPFESSPQPPEETPGP